MRVTGSVSNHMPKTRFRCSSIRLDVFSPPFLWGKYAGAAAATTTVATAATEAGVVAAATAATTTATSLRMFS